MKKLNDKPKKGKKMKRYSIKPIDRILNYLKKVKKASKTNIYKELNLNYYSLEKNLQILQKAGKVIIKTTTLENNDGGKMVFTTVFYKK